MHRQVWLGPVCVVLLSACNGVSSYSTRDVSSDFRFPNAPDYGLIVISTRKVDTGEASSPVNTGAKGDYPPSHLDFLLEYSDVHVANQPKTGRIPAASKFNDFDFQDPPGYLTIRKLGAGEHRMRVACGRYPSNRSQGSSFTVKPGKVIYLGEVHVTSDCTARVFDEWERDQKLVLERMKNLRPEDLEKQLLD
ncbi:hypothetical protein MFUL124B02_30110 [Myxococcus fulvus 124B02]|nr:hypothetical protein MFUL124B02_30110 [Myxococcus fulvus 124B02]